MQIYDFHFSVSARTAMAPPRVRFSTVRLSCHSCCWLGWQVEVAEVASGSPGSHTHTYTRTPAVCFNFKTSFLYTHPDLRMVANKDLVAEQRAGKWGLLATQGSGLRRTRTRKEKVTTPGLLKLLCTLVQR